MTKKLWILLALGAGLITLTADDCLTETKTIEVPVAFDTEYGFKAVDDNVDGDTSDSDFEIIDVRQELMDAEEDEDLEDYDLESAVLESGWWRVTNLLVGDASLTISGTVTVTRLETGASANLIDYSAVLVGDVLGEEYSLAPLTMAGVEILNDALADYIDNRDNPPAITLRFDWAGTASDEPYNFCWDGLLKITITGLVEVDAPK